MITPTPETHYINCGPGDTPNPYYNQQNGYVLRPHPGTIAGLSAAVEQVQKILLPENKPSRPLNKKQYNKSRPVVTRTLEGRTQKNSPTFLFQKCGPCYFPVTKN